MALAMNTFSEFDSNLVVRSTVVEVVAVKTNTQDENAPSENEILRIESDIDYPGLVTQILVLTVVAISIPTL